MVGVCLRVDGDDGLVGGCQQGRGSKGSVLKGRERASGWVFGVNICEVGGAHLNLAEPDGIPEWPP